ncbi:MAG: ABC transporter substrate-binding protein [Chloroflexi bacterium]|nr:ABC transporter substrate-binding protein [Chloroflexota bacterium]
MKKLHLIAPLLGAILLAACGGGSPAASPGASTPASGSAPSAAASGSAVPKPATSAATAVASASTSGAPSAAASGSSAASPSGSASAAAKPSGSAVTVRVGGLGSTIDRAFDVGMDKGFFAELGINIDLTTFRSATEVLPLLATNKLDVGTGGSSPGFFNAQAQGVGAKIVSDVTLIKSTGRQTAGLILRADLADSVKTVADLKGKNVAINNTQGIGEEQVDKVLNSGGISTKDVNLIAIPYTDQLAALTNKKIDAAMMIDPFATIAQQQKVGVAFFDLAKVMPNYPAQWLFYSVDFAKNQPDVAQRFMVAHMKAIRYVNDAVFKGKNSDDLINIYVAHNKGSTADQWKSMGPVFNEVNGAVNMDAINNDQDYYIAHGWQKQKIDPKTIVDTSFSEAALKTLGPYQE